MESEDVSQDACWAVLLAGGLGRRMAGDRPKQLMRLGDRTVLEHAVAAFAGHRAVGGVLLVVPAGEPARGARDEAVRQARAIAGPGLVVVEGGPDRSDSTRNALDALSARGAGRDTRLLVHDVARPLVTRRILDDAVAALADHHAAATLLPSTDSVVRIDPSGRRIVEALPRHTLRRHQTPQAFRLGVLARAHELARADAGFVATDDVSVVMAWCPDVDVAIVDGDAVNLKITEPVDLVVAEALLAARDVGDDSQR